MAGSSNTKTNGTIIHAFNYETLLEDNGVGGTAPCKSGQILEGN
jgi:hypothetical protein